jgi:hypothetical protein
MQTKPAATDAAPISKSEREHLQRLIRQREKMVKSAAKQRSADKAKQKVATRCRELGIPARFAPTLDLRWVQRGYHNLIERRRAELRRMAQTKIEAIEKATTEIELSCLQAQTELAVAGLTSKAAHAFLNKLLAIDTLMPRLSFAQVAGEAEPPVAEQLVSPNTLRQRRYRERQALRNAQTLLATKEDNSEAAS